MRLTSCPKISNILLSVFLCVTLELSLMLIWKNLVCIQILINCSFVSGKYNVMYSNRIFYQIIFWCMKRLLTKCFGNFLEGRVWFYYSNWSSCRGPCGIQSTQFRSKLKISGTKYLSTRFERRSCTAVENCNGKLL